MPQTSESLELDACRRVASTCAYFNVRRATRILGEVYDRELRPFGIAGTQFSVLVATALLEEPTVGRLAEVIGADRTTMSRALRPLERDGWIESAAGLTDHRERRARLTEAGKERLVQAIHAWERAQRIVAAAMGEADLGALLAGARRVHAIAPRLVAGR
jgi:DNA-binding MarR family transcriptional regulator